MHNYYLRLLMTSCNTMNEWMNESLFLFSTVTIITALEPYNEASTHSILDLRPRPTRIFNDTSKLMGSKYSFHVDAARLWNLAPPSLRSSTTLGQAKTAILAFARSLPVWRKENRGRWHLPCPSLLRMALGVPAFLNKNSYCMHTYKLTRP